MYLGDTNQMLPYKTNTEEVTKAQRGFNHLVYVALWLKTMFDGNNHTLNVPGMTQNHELINLVKPLHIRARTGSQKSVVTIYAHMHI